MASNNFTYMFFRIPKDNDNAALLAHKYKQLRLKALQTAPSSFGSNFERESAFPDSVWIERLKGDKNHTFIAIDSSKPSNQQEMEWVGQVTMRGPFSREEFDLPDIVYDADQREAMAAAEERWDMVGMFVSSEHRRRGLARSLVRQALDYINYEYRPQQQADICVRLMVMPDNRGTAALYRQLGFAQVNRRTLAEAAVANGDKGVLPGDVSSKKRSELIMVMHMKRMATASE